MIQRFDLTKVTIDEPVQLTAVENPILYRFKTDFTDDISGKAKATIQVNDSDIGDYIIVKGVKFNVSQTPRPDEIYERVIYYENDSRSFTNNELAQSVVNVLTSNIVLNSIYKIYAIDNIVYLESYLEGENFDLNDDNFYQYTEDTGKGFDSFIMTVQQNGVDKYQGDKMKDFGFYVKVYVDNLQYLSAFNVYNLNYVQTMRVAYNRLAKNNEHFIDVSSLLKNYVSTTVRNGVDTWYDDTAILAHGVEYGVYFTETDYNSDKKIGIIQNKFSINAALSYTVDNNITNVFRFLMDTDFTRFVELDNDIIFSLFKATGSDSSEIRVGVDFNDATFSYNTNDIYTSTNYYVQDINSAGVHHVKLRWDWLVNNILNNYSDKSVYSINVYVITRGFLDVETKFFIRSEFINRDKFNIVFLNTRAGLENYTFTGEITTSLDSNYESFYTRSNLNTNIPEILTNKTTDISVQYVLNSSPLKNSEYRNLVELAKSTQIYLLRDSEFIQLRLDSVDYNNSTNDEYNSISLTLIDVVSENNIKQ